jgi:hypothetical protein
MATEKQLAANRANAQKSTGPKTAAGRLKSSRNAFRHGLSLPLRLDMVTLEKADAIARLLTPDQADAEQLTAATEVAQAQSELLRVRAVRTKLMAELDLTSGNLEHLRLWRHWTGTSGSPPPNAGGHRASFEVLEN